MIQDNKEQNVKQTCDEHNDRSELGYTAWHEWAERRSKTHRQVKCRGCGLYRIWLPKVTPRQQGTGGPMTAREELIEAMAAQLDDVNHKKVQAGAALNALTPDLWLRYGLEMGWVEQIPGALAYPDIVTYGIEAIRDLREAYDEALKG